MKRIEYLKTDLSSLPLPQVGYKTIGIDTDGVVKTIDDQGVIEGVGVGGGSGGKVGISDTDGVYTYYADLTTAFAAASAGQTVKQFTDIVETTDITITVPLNVHWDLNGYTYEKTTGTSDVVGFPNVVNSINNITNGTIKSSSLAKTIHIVAGTSITINGMGLRIIGTSTQRTVDLKGTTNTLNYAYVENTSTGVACWFGNYNYVTALSVGNGYGFYRVNITNFCNSTSIGGVAYESFTGSETNHLTARSLGGIAVILNGGKMFNVKAYSSASYAFFANSTTELFDSYGFSSANNALRTPTLCKFSNSTFHSSVAAACFNNNFSDTSYENIYNNCTFISDASYVIFLNHYHTFNDCNFINNWDNAAGHCLLVQPAGANRETRILGGSMEVTNAGASFIDDYGGATSLSWAGVKFYSNVAVTTPISANVTQAVTNLEDNQGNIIINV